MKGTQLKDLFAVAAILFSYTIIVDAVPTQLLQHDCQKCRVPEPSACQAPVPTLGKIFQDITTQGIEAYIDLAPAVGPSPSTLTPEEASKVEAIRSQAKQFFLVSMPEVTSLLNSNAALTPAQVEQVNNAVSQRIIQLAAIECLIIDLAPKYNFSCAQKQTVTDIAKKGGDLFGAIAKIVSDPNVQPVLTPAQAEEIKKLFDENQKVFDKAYESFDVPKPTPAPSCSSGKTVGKLVQEVLAQGVNASNILRPTAGNINMDQLTPSEANEVQAILTQSLNFHTVLLPCVVEKLNSNATLTPAQVQQVKDVFAQKINTLTAVKYLVSNVGPRLNYNCVQQKTIIAIATVGIDLYGELLEVVDNTNAQSTLSPAQLAQLTKLIADSGEAMNAAVVAFNVGPRCASLPTTTTTPAPQVCYRN